MDAHEGDLIIPGKKQKDVDETLHVSVQFSTHHIYPLTCLWVKPVTDDSSL